MATSRMRRVNQALQEVIGVTIGEELHDPRIGFVTITAVDTSSDLRTARVHFSVLGSDQDKQATLEALTRSRAVLQSAIASQVKMKRTPTLTFVYDDSIERADRLNRMLSE
jgi:ribosome-binding factor A